MSCEQKTCQAVASWRRATQTWWWSTKIAKGHAPTLREKTDLCLTPTRSTRTRTPSASLTGILCWMLKVHKWTCLRSLFMSPVQSMWKVAMAPCQYKPCLPALVSTALQSPQEHLRHSNLTYFAYILIWDWKDFDFTSIIHRFLPPAALFGFQCICLFSVDGRWL